jgi:hypothetical protein
MLLDSLHLQKEKKKKKKKYLVVVVCMLPESLHL